LLHLPHTVIALDTPSIEIHAQESDYHYYHKNKKSFAQFATGENDCV